MERREGAGDRALVRTADRRGRRRGAAEVAVTPELASFAQGVLLAFGALLPIVNPFGNAAMFVPLTADLGRHHARRQLPVDGAAVPRRRRVHRDRRVPGLPDDVPVFRNAQRLTALLGAGGTAVFMRLSAFILLASASRSCTTASTPCWASPGSSPAKPSLGSVP